MLGFKRNEIITAGIILLLILSAIVSKKVEIFSNIMLLCALILFCIYTWKNLMFKDRISKIVGILIISLAGSMYLSHLNISLGEIPKYLTYALFVSLCTLYTNTAYKKVSICTLWLILAPLVLCAIVINLLQLYFTELDNISQLFISCVLYMASWYFMINRAETKVIDHSLKTIFSFSFICFLLFNYIIDFVPNDMFTQSVFNSYEEVFKLGYSLKDILNIFIKTMTYPLMVNCIIFYLILKNREYKLNN